MDVLSADMVAQNPHSVQMERLDRGVVTLPAQDKGIFVSWRLLGTDPSTACFDVERNGKVIASQIRRTNFTDKEGTTKDVYRIIAYQQNLKMDVAARREVSKAVSPWNDLYKSLPVSRPPRRRVS